MRIQVLHVPDCPNTAPLLDRIAQVIARCDDIQVDSCVVRDVDGASATGMTGSPTLLVDGVDPFADPGAQPSLSCRLYRDEAGALTGLPSPTQLRAALTGP